MVSKRIAVVIAALSMSLPVHAEDAAPGANAGRYSFSKVADGYLRLDTQSGEVALCSQQPVGWACLAAAEDRAALESEIARLRRENATLKKDMLARGLPLPPGVMPEPPGRHLTRRGGEADLDRVMAFVGHLWHRLVEAIASARSPAAHRS